MHERGLASAEILKDQPAQALMYIGIAQAYLGQRMYRTTRALAAKAVPRWSQAANPSHA